MNLCLGPLSDVTFPWGQPDIHCHVAPRLYHQGEGRVEKAHLQTMLMFTFLASRFHTVRPHYLHYNYSIVNSRTAGLKHGNVWQLSTKTSSKDSPDGDLPSLMMATQKFLCITFSALSHSPGESLHTYWWRHGRFPHIAVTCSTRSVTGGWDREPKQTVLFGLNVWFQLIVKTDSAHKAYITYVT